MITEYFWPQLGDVDLKDMCHTANVTINLLETKFGERVSSGAKIPQGNQKKLDAVWFFTKSKLRSLSKFLSFVKFFFSNDVHNWVFNLH